MATTTVCPNSKHIDLPCLHKVDWWRPFVWLMAGWEDFKRDWMTSLALGLVFALLGYLLTHYAWSHLHTALTLTTGFLLMSPFLAIGFYELSRRRESEPLERTSPRENLTSIFLFAVMLMFIFSVWERLSAILTGIYLGPQHVPDASLGWLLSSENMVFLIAFIVVGALVAAATFALSVISLPMLMDRQVDLVTAIICSLYAVRLNPLPMLLWAGLIAALTALGFATASIALVVIFPLLGHGTWHAYRDLTER